ncbi:MAG: hypothetical protein KDK55_07165, partial [Chlamydiia bacterium]|nr:hypothetical protein [Chlamydiia bacterium]
MRTRCISCRRSPGRSPLVLLSLATAPPNKKRIFGYIPLNGQDFFNGRKNYIAELHKKIGEDFRLHSPSCRWFVSPQ